MNFGSGAVFDNWTRPAQAEGLVAEARDMTAASDRYVRALALMTGRRDVRWNRRRPRKSFVFES